MEQKNVKIGFIGLSDWAIENHMIPMLNNPIVQFSGGYDTDAAAFDKVKQQLGIDLKSYEDIYDLILASDALVICSPAGLHQGHLSICLMSRKHTMCQHPFYTELKEIDFLHDAVNLAKKRDVVVSSFYPRHYDPMYIWLKKQLEELVLKFGKIISVKLDFSYPTTRCSKSGDLKGKFFNQDIDYFNLLLGSSPFESTTLVNSDYRYEVVGQRKDNISFSARGTCCLADGTPYENIEVRFETATFYLYCGKSADKCFVMNHQTAEMKQIEMNIETYSQKAVAQKVNDNFINAICGTEKCYFDISELLSSLLAADEKKNYQEKDEITADNARR